MKERSNWHELVIDGAEVTVVVTEFSPSRGVWWELIGACNAEGDSVALTDEQNLEIQDRLNFIYEE